MIASRQVPFEMVRDILKEMTSEGGKFYNMQEIQSNTLKGKLSKLKDQWEMSLNEIGQKNGTVIHKAIDGLIDLVKNWEKVGKILRTVIIAYGAYKVALLAAWGIEKLITAGKMIKTFATGIKVTHSFTAAIKGMNLSLSATLGLVGLLGGLIYAFATNTDDAAESTRDLDAELQDMHETAEDMVGSFDAAISYLQSLTRGTEAYRNAINRINDAYGSYLPNLLTEADSYEEIAEKANLARIAIREKTRQEMAEKLKNQFKYNGKALQEYQKAFNDMMDAQYAQYGSIGPLFVRLAAEEIAKSSGTDGIVTDDEIDEIF
jgi:methyl-accepting chemotaxis protein